MTGRSVSRRNDKFSIKHKNIPFEGETFECTEFDHPDTNPSGNYQRTISSSDPQSSEVLSTGDLISAVGYAWDRASAVLLPKTCTTCKTEAIQGGGILRYSTDEETSCASTSANAQPSSSYINSSRNSAKLFFPQPSYEIFSFWRIVLARSSVVDKSSMERCLLSTRVPSSMGRIYGWTNLAKQNNQVNSVLIESKMAIDDYSENSGDSCVPVDTTSTFDSLTTEVSASKSDFSEPLSIPSGISANNDLKVSTSRYSENEIVSGQHFEVADCEVVNSRCEVDCQETNLASVSHVSENGVKEDSNRNYEHQKDQGVKSVEKSSSDLVIKLSEKEKPQYALAKQEHAFAGAMAGIFVSLCLHPMDTVKTVIQSSRADQKTLHNIGRSIIAERGIFGLYRGISSNILSSAPISAVYTFTYESAKKSLLPLLPKEYHSLAHCTAGGCASIATSFIFTPSEHIKQQMQVGSHYRNCWNALIQVVQKGGLPSLYAGWGAVLCRNVPHSIIKFYTYESLKQIMLPSSQPNAQANIIETLVCGGLAGSMASLFTTPFDVVKTRLQTQIPGSTTQYGGVFKTLTEIGKHEGLKGLYRGLTPRLVMYMIQGALFFASYESFKKLFSLEVPQLSAQTFQEKKDESTTTTILPSTVSVTA